MADHNELIEWLTASPSPKDNQAAALQPQPAAAVSDEAILRAAQLHMGVDAVAEVGTPSIIATARAILALRPQAVPMTGAARDVLAERHRQISAEGWTPEHLEACPFCGGDAEYVSVGDRGYVRISCKNAVSCGHHGSAMPRAADAAQAWNTRAGTEMETSSGPSLHWRCFHCNYIARSHAEALAHFGPGISERPASCLTQRPAAQEVDGVPEHLIPRIIKGVIESAAQAKGVDHDH